MVSTLNRSLLFILAPLFLKASCPVQAATLPIDLSVDFEQAPLYNANEGSDVLIDYAQTQPDIKGFIVIENGEVVSEYYDDSHDETTLGEIWSCTKSWTSLFFGMLEKEGLISTSDRLVDVRDGGFWNNVGDAFYRKELPIDLILTMTAGLRTPL